MPRIKGIADPGASEEYLEQMHLRELGKLYSRLEKAKVAMTKVESSMRELCQALGMEDA